MDDERFYSMMKEIMDLDKNKPQTYAVEINVEKDPNTGQVINEQHTHYLDPEVIAQRQLYKSALEMHQMEINKEIEMKAMSLEYMMYNSAMNLMQQQNLLNYQAAMLDKKLEAFKALLDNKLININQNNNQNLLTDNNIKNNNILEGDNMSDKVMENYKNPIIIDDANIQDAEFKEVSIENDNDVEYNHEVEKPKLNKLKINVGSNNVKVSLKSIVNNVNTVNLNTNNAQQKVEQTITTPPIDKVEARDINEPIDDPNLIDVPLSSLTTEIKQTENNIEFEDTLANKINKELYNTNKEFLPKTSIPVEYDYNNIVNLYTEYMNGQNTDDVLYYESTKFNIKRHKINNAKFNQMESDGKTLGWEAWDIQFHKDWKKGIALFGGLTDAKYLVIRLLSSDRELDYISVYINNNSYSNMAKEIQSNSYNILKTEFEKGFKHAYDCLLYTYKLNRNKSFTIIEQIKDYKDTGKDILLSSKYPKTDLREEWNIFLRTQNQSPKVYTNYAQQIFKVDFIEKDGSFQFARISSF